MKRVTGIGGIFFQANDAPALRAWYAKHLGIDVQPWGGASFARAEGEPGDGATAWTIAERGAETFAPSHAPFMINYRVDDLAGLLAQLAENGVPIHKGPESDDNGTFAWIIDPDGNKLELWQPAGG